MKLRHSIFLIALILSVGLSADCKADTIDNYQIYIGKDLKITEASFNPLYSTIPFIKLDSSNFTDTLSINLSHCTNGASGRQLKLTDTSNHTIMLWDFGDKSQKSLMSIPISEIMTAKRVKNFNSLLLYYVDKEYPIWRLLTPVAIRQVTFRNKDEKAGLQKFNNKIVVYLLLIFIFIFLIAKIIQHRSPNR